MSDKSFEQKHDIFVGGLWVWSMASTLLANYYFRSNVPLLQFVFILSLSLFGSLATVAIWGYIFPAWLERLPGIIALLLGIVFAPLMQAIMIALLGISLFSAILFIIWSGIKKVLNRIGVLG